MTEHNHISDEDAQAIMDALVIPPITPIFTGEAADAVDRFCNKMIDSTRAIGERMEDVVNTAGEFAIARSLTVSALVNIAGLHYKGTGIDSMLRLIATHIGVMQAAHPAHVVMMSVETNSEVRSTDPSALAAAQAIVDQMFISSKEDADV